MHENTFSTFDNIFRAQKYVLPAKKALQIFQFHEVAACSLPEFSTYFHNSCMKIA